MTKTSSILHRAAALLAALCLLAGMALPVYATQNEPIFFGSDAETIPAVTAETTAEESTEPEQNPDVTGSETVPGEENTPPAANEPKTETETTGQNTETVPNHDGKTQETTDEQPPATDNAPAADNAATVDKAPAADNAAAADNAPTADKDAAADKNADADKDADADNADADNADDEEDTMLAADVPSNDGANADTDVSTGYIPTTANIYFEDDGTYDTLSATGGNWTVRFHAITNKSNDFIHKVMEDTGKTVNGKDGKPHKIFRVTLNSADYPMGGFYRIIFQYYGGAENKWQAEINAFGKENVSNAELTAIDLLAGKRFVREGITKHEGDDDTHINRNQPYNPSQWKRVDYYYKDMPFYFKNESGTALTNVTATFYKLKDDTTATEETGSQPIGTVDAGKFAAQQIRIPNNESRFVKFTWGENGQSELYDFTTDYTENSGTGAQKLDLTTQNCYVYNGTGGTWASTASDLLKAGNKIYFDATLSEYSYQGEGPEIERAAMPVDGKTLYCLLTDSNGKVKPLQMEQETTATAPTDPTDPAPDTPAKRKLWYCEIPKDGKTYTAVQFSTKADPSAPAYNKTKTYSTAQIPPNLQNPCFFADDGDPTAYNTNDSRDGYWGEKDSIRDAESGKGTPVVDIASNETFTQESGTKYITSTLYDYYTDYELNGLNRDTYPDNTTGSQRGFVTFEQFNRALSSAYEANGNVLYPLYTGHFQPSKWDFNSFADVAKGMGLLYGWGEVNSPDYKKFMAVNNSTLDIKGDGDNNNRNYTKTFQGLVEDTTSDSTKDGLPLLKRKDEQNGTALPDPHFNKDFLQGQNAFNTVLGKVYENVSFPLKKKAVFAPDPDNPSETDAKYWYFDSNETSLYLKQDSALQSYYLAGSGTKETSRNRGSDNGESQTPDKKYGFFPFNQTVTGSATKYNYGFGAKLQFDFTLTKDGNVVVGKDTNGDDIKVPIQFFFSGDDDVWVYIDGELVLDVGGAHDRAAGLLEFGKDADGKNTVTSWVSDAKAGGQVYTPQAQDSQKNVTFNKTNYTFRYKAENKNENGTEIPKTLKDQPTHTLTMYYMERGMWESNMALAFNFPDHNELQVEKKVDVSDVNPLFQDSFKNQKIFTFNIQNLATHYEAKDAYIPIIDTKTLPDTAYSSATGLLRYVPSLPVEVDKGKGSAVLWESDKDDPTSANRDQRRGTLAWDTAIDITKYSYLTFDVYVVGEQSETCALSNLYVELWDEKGKQMGCLHQKGLQSSDVYGAATALHPGQWYTVRMMLKSLEKDADFNKTKLKSITVGDNYKRSIYLRNFTFSSAPAMPEQTGFTTAQYNIPDYGSAETGELKNAAYAVYSSNFGNGDVVDENGQFLLQADEIATFNDQFRRGSYIALKEEIDTDLYDTTWTVYENDVPVTSVGGKKDVVTVNKDVKTLQNIGTTAPDDGRTEQVVKDKTPDGHETLNKYTEAQKPKNANTLVFRSYSDNAAEDELTKLKVVFNNKVKTGKLVIRKVLADVEGETLENQEFTFTVRFGDVGGQSLGKQIPEKEYICQVTKQKDGEYYGEIEIDKIPVGTRFVVSENPTTDTSLQSVSIKGGKDCAVAEDGVRVYGAIVEGDENPATATFVNTTRKLIDITVKKEWKKQDNTTDIPQADLPKAIYLQLQRTETPEQENTWQTVKIVELKKPTDYNGWVTQFTGLDKYDANKPGDDHTFYTYRVLESATETGDWRGDKADDVIKIDGKTYKVLNPLATGQPTDKTLTLTLTLTNKLQDAKYNLVITKLDAQDKNKKLGDVEFKLEKLDAESSEPQTRKTDAETGQLTFAGLTPGDYRLTETKTAKGYTLLAEPIEFTLTADGHYKRGDETREITPDDDGVYNIALTVYNRKGFALPHTGADAPSLWLLIGLPALVAVLLVLVFRYNKKGGKHS